MRLLAKFFSLFRRANPSKPIEASNMDQQNVQPASAAFAGVMASAAAALPVDPAAAPAGELVASGNVQLGAAASLTPVAAPAVVASNAGDRLALGIRLAGRISSLAPSASEDQVFFAAKAALDALMPAN
ncbi:TPA: hypothetical protein QDB21_005662 [Burkholderia vietnamiensis]|nr:hypothetical protein [Burkholderia vietnamiensis]